MSTDIHAHVEFVQDDGYTNHIADFGSFGDYVLYCLLAGVRHRAILGCMADAYDVDDQATTSYAHSFIRAGGGVGEPKGEPDNLSTFVKSELKQWGADAHSTSWMDVWELRRIAALYALVPSAEWVISTDEWLAYYEEHGELMPKYDRSEVKIGQRPIVLDGIIALMESLNASAWKGSARLVFWFDN